MKVVRFDQGFTFDDPNLRWGDPSVQLEIGDPGFINTGQVPAAQTTHTKSHSMTASNETPRPLNLLLPLSRDIHAGLVQLEVTIGMHHHLSTTLMPLILKLAGDPGAAAMSNANKGSQLVYKESEVATGAANDAHMALSDGAVKKFLTGYRTVMEGIHGPTLNAGWEAAGFTFDKTKVPRNHEDRETLLMSARTYLAAHPEYEATQPQPSGPALAINDTAALALHGQFLAARTAVSNSESTQAACKDLRDADQAALYKEVSETIAELRDQLADDDVRWEQMGLNIPANPSPPEAATGLTVTAAGATRELAEWTRARRSTYNRVFIKIQGVDADFRFLDRTEDVDFLIKSLTAGSTISVYVIAANEGGEAAPSPTVTKVVGV